MDMVVFFFVPLVVFLTIVAPLWLTFHYITRWKSLKQRDLGDGMIAVPKEEMIKLRDSAGKLNNRLAALEKILDQDRP